MNVIAALLFLLFGQSLPRGPMWPSVNTSVSVVQTITGNNFTSCVGVLTCSFAYPSNVTSGNLLVVAAAPNANEAATISGTGTGCVSTSWTAGPTETAVPPPVLLTWTGTASGTGPCTVSVVVLTSTNIGMQEGEYGSSSTPVIDATGTGSETGTGPVVVTAGNATTAAGDYGLVFYASQNGSSGTFSASGWTALVNQTFQGSFGQSGISSGSTPSASMNAFNSGRNMGVMIILKG